MEKYGVELDPEKVASEEETNKCLTCGEELPEPQFPGDIPICRRCGTRGAEQEG